MELSVLIVTHNSMEFIRDSLTSVVRATCQIECEILVIDNASQDESVALICAEFPSVRLVRLEHNIGFGRACNHGAALAKGDYLFLMNPDAILHAHALDGLLQFARSRPEHGIYGGRALDGNGDLQRNSCWAFPGLWSIFCHATCLNAAFRGTRLFDPESLGGWARDSVREVDMVSGFATLIHETVWTKLGGFDARFFLYGEDADLCKRAWDGGWRPVIIPLTVITHIEGASTPDDGVRMTLILKGKVTFLLVHWPSWQQWIGRAMFVIGAGVRALLGSRTWRAVWSERKNWSSGYPELRESDVWEPARP